MTIHNKVYEYLQSGRSWYQRSEAAIETLTVHHDAIPHDSRSADEILTQIRNIHANKGWPGASYHYFIHRDGEIYQLNKHTDITWHDSVNDDSIGIVVTGYFHPNFNNTPTKEQFNSLQWLLDKLQDDLGVKSVVGHRDRGQTACPGDRLYPWVKNYQKGDMADDMMEVSRKDWQRLMDASEKGDKLINALGIRGNIADATQEQLNSLYSLKIDRDRYRTERDKAQDKVDELTREKEILAKNLEDCLSDEGEKSTDAPRFVGWRNNGMQVRVGDKTFNYELEE